MNISFTQTIDLRRNQQK